MKPFILIALVCAASPQLLRAGGSPIVQAYALDTGKHSNEEKDLRLCFSKVIAASADTGVRVHFKEFSLGERSFVKLTSLRDGGTQKLDAGNMTNWFQTSAVFNGDRVLLELFTAPGETGIGVVVDELLLPCHCQPPTPVKAPVGMQSLCGSDDRVSSTDNRVGRTSVGCTAWLISSGAVLSAGHCWPNGATFMINVPASGPDGTLTNSAPDDQFPIVPGSEHAVWDDNGTPSNAADDIDYVIFSLNPDNQGRRAHERVGFFRVTTAIPPNDATIRVTGFGTDNTPPGSTGGFNAQNQTQQTATGGFAGQRDLGANGTGRILRHFYAVDTEAGNSGSPIIWEDNGFTIGVHTASGCTSEANTSNSGTSFNQPNLQAAVENFPSVNTRYLDAVTYPGAPPATGSIFAPDHNLTSAYNHVPTNGTISMVRGTYPRAAFGNSGTFGADGKGAKLIAPVGPVTIGQ